ncbi:MAG: TonB-dependent receptor [Salinivirgaceae bacterium]|jgi:iron complex outermembrane receptor protein|nr:TonB-dependent receptor [Salinivirgaceae bacterium]
MRKQLTLLLMLLLSAGLSAQVAITGFVRDENTGEPLIGATIFVEETSEGTFTLLNGEFDMPVEAGDYTLRFSYIGYNSITKKVSVQGVKDMGTINLKNDAVGLNEVRIVADVAVGRETPVAVSTITPRQITEKLGNQEFPEIMKSTPSVYATKSGGGFGDSRINIRGFDARNTATLINGVPVNDMENGWVYWSNWAGLADVTRSIQIQRGLGASKLALPSLGGTINILTKTTDATKGGNLSFAAGNDAYTKYGATFSTGLSDKGWASSIALSKTTGDGYVDGTQFESYSYYISISKRLNANNSISLSIFGAPQEHGQRRTMQNIETYQNNKSGIKYNSDWGYKGGEIYYLNKNFYHKPQAILNYFWTINEKSNLMTAAYASIGEGGGTGGYGNTSKFSGDYLRDGQINYDRIVDENITLANAGAETIMRASMNNHAWYGILSNYQNDITEEIKLSAGIDGRYYKGEHYREVTDLLGGEFFIDDSDFNNSVKVVKPGDKIGYHNDGLVSWGGSYVTGEYISGNLSAFLSGSASIKSYKRIDYFNYFSDDLIDQINNNEDIRNQYEEAIGDEVDFNRAMEGRETDWQSFFGYVFKGGANYNITETMNVFLNTGYFERQPDFDAVFLNFVNNINEDAVNEKVLSFELGYGYQTKYIKAQANLYHTQWKDKTFTQSVPNPDDDGATFLNANILGVEAIHQGLEVEATIKPIPNLKIDVMASLGNWRWGNNVENVYLTDDNQNNIDTVNVLIKDVRVGDAAQTTLFIGASYELIPNLKVGMDLYHYDNIFASFDPTDRDEKSQVDGKNPDSWKLPNYQLLDANISYDFDFGNLKAILYGKFNNILDTEYVAEAQDGSNHDWDKARVYYGWGRSWSMGVKINF